MTNVCVLGGTGFVGRHLLDRLATQNCRVRVLTRRVDKAKGLTVLPTVDLVEADIFDDRQLEYHFAGQDAVINLVGILHQGGHNTFKRVHAELARRVVSACRARGVHRLLHMSALNADPHGPSNYLATKGEGEATVLAAQGYGLNVTVFRPSVIFGPGDSFLNLFGRLVDLIPVMLLARPDARFQPVYVGDVAHAFAASLTDARTFGHAYELCGPKVYTLRELVEYVARLRGHRRAIVGLSDSLSYLQALLMELLPIKLLTRDNYDSMKIDNVCQCPFPDVFGIQPSALEAIAPRYLAPTSPRRSHGTVSGSGH